MRTRTTARLAAAWVLTLAVLPYAWGRVLVLGMMADRLETFLASLRWQWPYVALLGLGMAAVTLLTRGVAAELKPGRLRTAVAYGVPGSWLLTTGVLIAVFNGPLTATAAVVLLFIPSTLWVAWAAWMGYAPLSAAKRWGILAAFLALAPVFPLVMRVEGLTGSSQVDFAWRQGTQPDGAAYAGPVADAPAADLAVAGPGDFTQFLGPLRLGVLPDARLARDWETEKPRLLWRKPVGAGWGSFAVVNGYAVTQEQRGAEECVACYRVADGAAVWVHADPVRYDSSLGGPGPRATPTVAGGRVYAVGALGLLSCLDGATGRALWSVNILEDNEATPIHHGVCASPLVDGDRVVVCPTGDNGVSLVAYDRATGKRLWRSGKDQASYGSPILADLAGRRQILLYTSAGIAGHDAATGDLLWRHAWANRERVHCSQPIPHAGRPDQVFVSCGYGKGSALFRVERSGDGTWSTSTLWEGNNLKTKFTTAIRHGGHLYGLDDGILQCVDLATGKRVWKEGRYQHGQILLAGDLLLIQAESGSVVLVEPDPRGLRERGRLDALTGKTWNNPALAGRHLIVRNDREAACYELPAPGR